MRKRTKLRRIGFYVVLPLGLLTLVLADGRPLWAWFSTPDQRAQHLYRKEKYTEAAQLYTDPSRRGIALARAASFKDAAQVFLRASGPTASFNRANALLMGGNYEEAIQGYDQALTEKPGWIEAEENRRIAVVRAERTKKEGGNMTGGLLGADEVQFDNNPSDPNNDQTETIMADQSAEDAFLKDAWLQRVQTTPSDFLRTKFNYQLQAGQAGQAGEP